MLTNEEKKYIADRYVNWRPGKIHYWESLPETFLDDPAQVEESKQKPALILLHGYAASVEHWRHTFAGLKGRYRMYALDMLGFGLSDKPNGNQVRYSAGLWAKQVYDFLKFKKEEKVVLVGHSMGGMTSIKFSLEHPEMVAGLILIDSSGLPDQGQAEMQGQNREGSSQWGELLYSAIQAPLLGEAMAALLTSNTWVARRSLEQSYYDKSKITPQLVEQFLAPLRSPGARDSYLAVTRNFADYQLPLKPGDIKAPTVLIWGEFDRTMPPPVMLPRWQKLLPQAGVYVVAKAGHCPQDERPDLVNPQIIQFVENLVEAQTTKSA
jgi:pimeloyl-ACP methyl ester carboxylesterase